MINEGDKVPEVSLFNTEIKEVNLSKVSKSSKGPVVFAFFPGAFTSVCTKEMCHFRDDIAEFDSLKAKVYGISVDSPFSNKEFKDKNQINFEILSDYSRGAVKSFGIELNDFAKMKGYTAAKRSVFILDRGFVKFKWVSDDPSVEPDYNSIKEALKSFKS